ncbi:MAG TPA: exonuclease domain-containing protein [Gemmatimonadaceae bacterium]|nr:exonuclease domain-containing protein [Gemmatimonadaceae bacterium]
MSRAPRGGVAVLPPETLLVERARDFLAAGGATAAELVERVCQLPGAPAAVAEHLAQSLLGAHPEFVRDAQGRWHRADLAPRPASTAPTPLPGGVDELLRMRWAVVDVETTGGRPEGGDRITEIAAVVVENGAVQELYETLVNPQRSIPPWITALTNISWEMVKDAPRFADVCGRVTSLLDGRVFVAHNVSFDWRFVSAEVARATGQRLDGRRLCTVRMARRLLPQLPRRSLDRVADYYGVEIAARHRAAGDAVATAEVLLALLRDAADRGATTWDALDALLSAPSAARRRRRRPSALPRTTDGGEGS